MLGIQNGEGRGCSVAEQMRAHWNTETLAGVKADPIIDRDLRHGRAVL